MEFDTMMPVIFFRQDCQEIVKDWSREKKFKLAKKMSKITLEDGRYHTHAPETWEFPEVPNRKFSGLKIYAWMQELVLQTKGYDVDPEQTKMVKGMK
ncbi:hypothetical protein LCGC14_0535160 [marine sediment metagenome]|uniref:Uncharacterized protein n=1 Tax=marine sediment metagenome TaxID=412755 RepID=A0A0F9V2M4_9ZZZZ